MKCKNCKYKTEMDYDKSLQCHICPDCGFEDYDEEGEEE